MYASVKTAFSSFTNTSACAFAAGCSRAAFSAAAQTVRGESVPIRK